MIWKEGEDETFANSPVILNGLETFSPVTGNDTIFILSEITGILISKMKFLERKNVFVESHSFKLRSIVDNKMNSRLLTGISLAECSISSLKVANQNHANNG